jgi:hypothetical protein
MPMAMLWKPKEEEEFHSSHLSEAGQGLVDSTWPLWLL